MSVGSEENQGAASRLGRWWQIFLAFGEAVEATEVQRLELRVAALEAAIATEAKRPGKA